MRKLLVVIPALTLAATLFGPAMFAQSRTPAVKIETPKQPWQVEHRPANSSST